MFHLFVFLMMSTLDDESEPDGQSFSDPSSLTRHSNYTIHAFLIFFPMVSISLKTETDLKPLSRYTMAPIRDEEDWSDSDEEDVGEVETSVLLGVPDGPIDAASDINDVAVSRIGGHPVRSILYMYDNTEYIDHDLLI